MGGHDRVGDPDLEGRGGGGTDWIREPPGSGSQMNLLGSVFPPLPDTSAFRGFNPKPGAVHARSTPSLIPAEF